MYMHWGTYTGGKEGGGRERGREAGREAGRQEGIRCQERGREGCVEGKGGESVMS